MFETAHAQTQTSDSLQWKSSRSPVPWLSAHVAYDMRVVYEHGCSFLAESKVHVVPYMPLAKLAKAMDYPPWPSKLLDPPWRPPVSPSWTSLRAPPVVCVGGVCVCVWFRYTLRYGDKMSPQRWQFQNPCPCGDIFWSPWGNQLINQTKWCFLKM